MTLIDDIKGLLGGNTESEPVDLYECTDCSNLFTRTEGETARAGGVQCPNCESTDVKLAASSR